MVSVSLALGGSSQWVEMVILVSTLEFTFTMHERVNTEPLNGSSTLSMVTDGAGTRGNIIERARWINR